MSIRLNLSLFVLLMAAHMAFACGGYEDDSLLYSDAEFLRMPAARFVQELARLKAAETKFKHIETAHAEADKNLEAEIADVRAALQEDNIPLEQAADAVASLAEVRDDGRSVENRIAAISPLLPAEFQLYSRGRLGEPRYLTDLLALPAEQRRYRSTWAAFMMGRRLLETEPAKSIEWFRRVRELAAEGYHDSLGLAAASYGREAQAELALKHFDRAVDLYLLQLATGDYSAVQSLQLTASAAFDAQPATLVKLAQHPASRRVLTLFAAADGGPWVPAPDRKHVLAWMTAVEAANVTDIDYAEQLAWAAYQSGHYAMAQRWVDRAPADQPMALWIRAKLLLREGKIDPAMAALAIAVKRLPDDDAPPKNTAAGYDPYDSRFRYSSSRLVAGELGTLHLAKSQYVDALHLLLRARYWSDAAYIAERVLTVDELRGYVEKHAAVSPPLPDEVVQIRHLLARRLMRLGRWKDARPYYSPAEQVLLDQYITSIRRGYDVKLPEKDRGLALFEAARMMRKHGMELTGTELGPDVSMYRGSTEFTWTRLQGTRQGVLAVSADEQQRLKRPTDHLDRRFHYRYIAADHVWTAAELLPDDSPELADALNRAGDWLKNRDPLAAQRFYDALVRRCPNTAIGKKAAARKWFVSVE